MRRKNNERRKGSTDGKMEQNLEIMKCVLKVRDRQAYQEQGRFKVNERCIYFLIVHIGRSLVRE